MNPHERKSDETLDELKRFVEEESRIAREWREKHDRDAVTFREHILKEIRPFKEFANSLNWFWKICLGLAALVGSLGKFWLLAKDHVSIK